MTKSKLLLCNQNKLIQEEKERLRKLRLIQVREISKQNAAQLREAFKREKEKELNALKKKQEQVKFEEKSNELNEIKQYVQSEIDNIGQGHIMAANYNEHLEEKMIKSAEYEEKALLRGKSAMQAQREEKMIVENKENAHLVSRQFALEQERLRTAQVVKQAKQSNANNEQLNKLTESKKETVKMVTYHDANIFMNTRYHMPDSIVDKETSVSKTNFDARKEAVDEEQRQKQAEQDQNRMQQERLEKARLRGKHALEKEILSENYNEFLNELNVLEKADREKRQRELLQIPKEIFLPTWQREQEKNDVQLELEREFEKIYVGSNLRTEEMPPPVDVKQLDSSQSNMQDAELDLTLVDDICHAKEKELEDANLQNGVEVHSNEIPTRENGLPACTVSTQEMNPDPSTSKKSESESNVLHKLLDKIKKQREELAKKSAQLAAHEYTDDESSNISMNSSKSSVSQTEFCSDSLSERASEHLVISAQKQLVDVISNRQVLEDTLNEKFDTNNESLTSCSELSEDQESTILEKCKNEQKNVENKKNNKLMRGIMMSSHNVSSLHELENPTRYTTRTRSIDLSHASRDPMLAGCKELLVANDFKLAVEHKQNELKKKQEELEAKLKQLEEQEAQLQSTPSEQVKQQKQQQQIPNTIPNKPIPNVAIDSGNDHNYSITSSSILSSRSDLPNQEDLRRIQYQQLLLNKFNRINDECSSSTTTITSSRLDSAKLIEERKREYLKRLNGQSNNVFDYVDNADKNTVYSSDSGICSGSNNNFNLNSYRQTGPKPINLAVEHLNQEIMKQYSMIMSSSTSEIESKTSSETIQDIRQEINNQIQLTQRNLATNNSLNKSDNLFGLELFDSNNLCDVRDLSLEKLIGLQLQQTATSGSASSNDTLNEDFFNNENDLYNVATTDDDQDESTSSHQQQQQHHHILSLIMNNTSSKANDLKRQFIQDQLESIRKQKEQLQLQIQDQQQQQQQQSQNISKKNLFDLSTIKEVDTPISERNLKLNKNNNKLNEESESDDTINTLENVSKLSDSSLTSIKNYKRTASSTQLKKQVNETDKSALSDSSSLVSLTPSQTISSQSSISKQGSSSQDSSTTRQQKTIRFADTEQTPQVLNADIIRKKYAQLFNVSLFESSTSSTNSINSSLKSPMLPHLTDTNKVEYGQMIYDSLQTNNLTLSTSGTSVNTSKQHISSLMNSTSNSSSTKPAAFQTSSISNNTVNQSKKWFDILASPEQVNSTTNNTSYCEPLTQYPIEEETVSEHDETAISNCESRQEDLLEKTLQPLCESKLDQQGMRRQMSNKNDQTTISSENTSGGLFDRFLKNYTTTATTVSVMDEPELSFVSYRTTPSGQNSPKSNKSQQVYSSTNAKNSTCSNATSCTSTSNRTTTDHSLNTSSLIEKQIKELNKQFNNLSPIDAKVPNRFLEYSCSSDEHSLRGMNELTGNDKSSLILLSPNKLFGEKSSSLMQGLINDQRQCYVDTDHSQIEEGRTTFDFNQYVGMDNSRKSDSLISFEHHELSQLSMNNNNSSSQVKIFNSTPMVSVNRRQSSITTVTQQSSQDFTATSFDFSALSPSKRN
jgi:hypothetical protein